VEKGAECARRKAGGNFIARNNAFKSVDAGACGLEKHAHIMCMNENRSTILRLCWILYVFPGEHCEAQEKPKRPIDGIMDNSFFLEEAYNQDEEVVLHIFSGLYGWSESEA
jgi:hypothetical protein